PSRLGRGDGGVYMKVAARESPIVRPSSKFPTLKILAAGRRPDRLNGSTSEMKQLFAISAVLVSALVLGASMTRPVHAAETSPCQPERWAADMARFEQQDAEASPPKEAMLFVGSSSIRLWNLEE